MLVYGGQLQNQVHLSSTLQNELIAPRRQGVSSRISAMTRVDIVRTGRWTRLMWSHLPGPEVATLLRTWYLFPSMSFTSLMYLTIHYRIIKNMISFIIFIIWRILRHMQILLLKSTSGYSAFGPEQGLTYMVQVQPVVRFGTGLLRYGSEGSCWSCGAVRSHSQIVSRTIETTVARVVLLYFVYRWQDP
jgi:hypothetical protein